MKLKLPGLPGDAFFAAPRRAISGADEPRVAAPANAPLRQQHALSGFDEIAHEDWALRRIFWLLIDERADRHFELDVWRVLPRAVRPFAMAAAARVEFAVESEGDQRVDVRAGDGIDRAAFASVAAIGAATRNELLAPEAHAAGAAVPGLYEDVDFVDEHGGEVKLESKKWKVKSKK